MQTCSINVGWNFVKVSGLGVIRAEDLATHSFCRSGAVVRCSLVARHDGSETVFALEFAEVAQAQAAERALAGACDGVDVFGSDTDFSQEEVRCFALWGGGEGKGGVALRCSVAPSVLAVATRVQMVLHSQNLHKL